MEFDINEYLKEMSSESYYSVVLGDIKIYVDNKKVIDSVIKALECRDYASDDETLMDIAVTNVKKFKTTIKGIKIKYIVEGKFMANGLMGELMNNMIMFFKLACVDKSVDLRSLVKSGYVIELNYNEISFDCFGSLFRAVDNMHIEHHPNKTPKEFLMEFMDYQENDDNSYGSYKYRVECFFFYDYYGKFLSYNENCKDDKKFSNLDIYEDFVWNIKQCFDRDKEETLDSLEKYKDYIEDTFKLSLDDILDVVKKDGDFDWFDEFYNQFINFKE